MYENAQRLQPTPKPTEVLYAILFHDNTSANGNTLHYIVSQLHHRWHTSTFYLFPTDGVTVPSPSPFPYTRQPISHAKQPAWLPVALRLGRGMHAVQPSFWEEALPKIHTVGLSIPPPKIRKAGGAPFPIPYLGKQWSHSPSLTLGKSWSHCPSPSLGKQWSHCPSPTSGTPWSHPPLWGSCGAIAHPQPWGSSGAIAHPPLWGSSGAIAQPWGSSGAIAHPQPWGSHGAIAHPQHWGCSGAIAHPPIGGSTPRIPNLRLATPYILASHTDPPSWGGSTRTQHLTKNRSLI